MIVIMMIYFDSYVFLLVVQWVCCKMLESLLFDIGFSLTKLQENIIVKLLISFDNYWRYFSYLHLPYLCP
jgi:hypothetical protein